MSLLTRASRLGRAALAALLAVGALPIILAFPSGIALAGPPPVFTMFVPFSEQQISDGLFSIYGTGGTPSDVVTTIDITSAADNSIMYWDHWEDGYEADIANPVQPTTEIWGDANPANGAPPGVPSDLVDAGTIIFIQNNVALPRNPAVPLFDGRDKVASTRGFAMSRAGWDLGLGTIHAGAVAATDLSKYGTQFTIPVGENTGFSAFDYTGVTVMASDDNTVVEFDINGDGSVDQTNVLAEGETVFIDGGVNAGGTVSASKPIQTHLMTGERNSRYEGRWFEVFPAEIRGDEYVAAAGSTSAAERVTIFLQNPGTTTITVAVDAEGTANDTNLMIAPGAVASYDLPNGSGARFSSPGNPFIAVSGTVAVTGNSTWYDWGYSLVPTSSLTPGVVVGWGAGNPDGTQNYSPVWVAPLADTTIYVDIDGDMVADQTIPGVNAYQSVQIIDTTDNDMTGARIYTVDGTLLSVAWGQDPAGGECCNAYDLGSTVLPSTALVTTKTAQIVVDVNGDGNLNPGDTLEYTIRSVDAGALALTNIVVQDNLPTTLTYVPNTTSVDGLPYADDTVGTPFPVDGAGVLIPVLAPGASADVVFRAQLVDPFPLFTQTVRNTVLATADQGSANATSILPVVIPNLYIAKNSSAPGPLMPGEIFDYVIDVSNIDVGPQSGIDVTDTLPPELTWLSTTVARPIDDPGPGGSDILDDTFSLAQYDNNPTEWVTDWIETDSAGGGASGGNVLIVSELGSNRVRLRGGSSAITRAFDGAAWDEATLSYDYRPDSIDNGDWVSFQISTTGGSSWIELDRVIGPLTSAAYSTLNYDLTRYLGQDVHLRWVTSPGFSATGDSFYLDNVAVAVNKRVIEVVPGGAPPALYSGGELLTAENLTITVTVQLDAAVDPAVDSITNVASAVSAENPSSLLSDVTDEIARATIGDTVWHDQDGDGTVDGGEPRLAGVTVTLYDSGGTPIATDVTDAGGNYLFTDLDPADYTVAVTAGVPGGMATTFDADGGYDESTDVSVAFGEVATAIDFGYAFPVSLGDRVFSDIGGDGVENGVDFGIDGLTVTLTGPSHPGGTSTTTVAGTYGFANLLPGTYTVDVDTSPLSTAAYSTTGGDSQVVALTSGNDDPTVDFGYVLPAAIGDTVFHDLDADGDQDPGEPGFVGVDVTITGTGLPVGGLTTTTDATGYYLFSNLDAGDFTIAVTEGTGDLPIGYNSSTGGLVQLRSVLDDDIVFDVDFGFWTQATIGDFVFDDVNGNGAWDAGEPGIPGVPITVTGPSSVTAVVTDAFGAYDVSVDPGTYTVVPDTSGFPPGTVNTFNGVGPSVVVGSTDDVDTADFGYTFPATIGDFVWHDLDNDGVQDGGEPGLDGVDLTITGGTLPPGGVTTTTGGGGAYLFSSLDPGTYTITVDTATLPAGYVSSTGGDTAGPIVVVSGTARTDIDFGYRGTADMGDLIFHDLDADGVWDAGEPGLPGVELTLTGPGIPPGTTDTTDAGGNYLFADLDPGTYTVTVNTATVPAGYTVTAGTDSRSVTLESDTDILTVDLGYATTASIGDFVWDDLDGDGVFDVGEPGFDAVTVTLDDGITPITQDTVNGAYDFTGVAPGTYTVTVDAGDLPPGVVNTLGGVSQVVTVVSAEDRNDVDFAYYQPSTVGDVVWDDLDGDGVFDVGEPGFGGVTLTLTGGTLPPGGITDVTDGAGAYDFTGLAPGAYTVTLTATDLPAGAVNTFGGTSEVTTIQSGDDENDIDFGFYVPAAIGDIVWDDLDGDSVHDVGEPGITGVTVTLTGPGIPPGTTDTTDPSGLYGFPGLAPGTYTVTVDTADLAAGATSTTGGFATSTTITSGSDDLGIDFGVANPITIGDTVFDDLDGDGVHDGGEPGLAGVTLELSGPGVPPGTTVTTTGTGLYAFGDLDPGTYTVTITGVPAGYTNTAGGGSQVTTLESGETDATLDFGYYLGASIGDLVWDDLDGDGAFDAGEPGFDAVTITLDDGVTTWTQDTVDGAYDFVGLTPGTYTVTVDLADLPAGAVNTLGGASQSFLVTSGDDENGADFAFYVPGSIGDYVWNDLDGDGLQDDGPPPSVGIGGVDVTITGPSFPGGTTVTTDANGAYLLGGLAPGSYGVVVDTADLPPGSTSTTGGFSVGAVPVTSGSGVTSVDFGVAIPAAVGDLVFADDNGNGVFDAGDTPLPGVQLSLTGPGIPPGTTDVTDAAGRYDFSGLLPGTYTVTVDGPLPPGAFSTAGGGSAVVTLSSGETDTSADFGYAQPAAIGDTLFHDLDNDGVQDAGEPGLAAVDVTLTGPGQPPLGTTIPTGPGGAYAFTGLAPGTYTVTVDTSDPQMDPAFVSTTGGDAQVRTLTSDQVVDDADFGYTAPGSIGDFVFTDADGDGDQTGDSGLGGIVLTLTGGALPPGGITATTDGAGAYSFGNVLPGTYTVTVTGGLPAGAFPTTPGGLAQTLTISSGQTDDAIDFGFAQPATIGDFVFEDLDGDGAVDAGEPGFPAVDVTITGPTHPGGFTAPTDPSGGYSFGGLAPGAYTITVDTTDLPPGAANTLGGASRTVTVVSNEIVADADFGYTLPAAIGDFVFEDLDGDGAFEAGEPGLDGLTVTLTGGGLGAPLTTVTAGGGAYSFAGLDPGTYTATVTPPASGSSTTGGDARTLTIASGEDRLDIDVGYALAATIGDRIWHDLDADGAQDGLELGLAGIAVTLAGPSGPATATTDGLGDYVFANLLPGTYTVSYDPATVPVGAVSGAQLTPTTPGSIVVPIRSGDDVVTADIGFATTGTVGGTIYEDDDADGVGEPGEAGLAAITVELVDGSGTVVATVVTDGDGDYTFTGVAPGDHTVRVDESTLPAGFTRTSPASIPVTVVSDQAVSDIDVGYARPAVLGDLIWHDLDADGVRDAGEPGLDAIAVELVDGGGTVVATTATDGDGAYSFGAVDPGDYTVRVDLTSLPVGADTGGAFAASAGVPTSVPITVTSGETIDTIDFAFHTTAEIGDLVWHDLDADSVRDGGEPGMVVTVELVDGGGTVVASTTSAADGSYSFTGVAPGVYEVRVDGEPAGYSATTGNDPSTVVVVSDQVDDTVDFGFALLSGGSIGNEVWDDIDGDGVRDPGEPGVGGVIVELFLGGVSIDSRTTPATGSYLFANLAPGTYEVRIDPGSLPIGYAATTAGSDGGNTQTTTILSGEADLDVDFGFAAPAIVGDAVWHDLDGDGAQDAGEPGLAGVVVELLDASGTVVDSATTDGSGGYTLTAVPAGDYTVAVDPATTPVGANSGLAMVTTTATSFAVTLTSNEVRDDLDIGYVTPASIGDTIFDDLDGDGALDPGEPGLPGVTVVLTAGGGGTSTLVTDAAGSYVFTGVAPGDYTVSVDGSTLPAGAVAMTSASPVPVTVESDDLVDDVDLGYALPASLAGIVFVDAAGDGTHIGDSGMAGVTVELLDAGGTVIASMPTAADGSYVFTGLLPGGCTVRPLLPAGYGFTIPNTGDDTVDSDVLVPAGETATVWVASGEDVVDVDAGIVAPATIGDTVWVDLDGDGVQSAGEPGLGGVTVEIRTSGGAPVATTTTDPSGAYAFTVDPGLYTVTVLTPAGYQIDPGGDVVAVAVLSGESALDVDFGLTGAGTIGGDVVYDVSADGAIDPDDPGHPDVTVTATWPGPDGAPGTADDVAFTVVTSDGSYLLTDLPPGDYVVEVDIATLPDGLVDPTVDPDGVVDLATTIPVAGAPVADVDFASTGTASLGDNVFRDDDEDGILDPGEPGVGGIVVTATVMTSVGVRTFTTVTDANGFYRFDDLPAGDYVVTLDPTTVPVGLVPSISTRTTTLVINGTDDSLDLALVARTGPVAADDTATAAPEAPVAIGVLTNDSVPTGTTVTVTAVTQPPAGTVVIDPGGGVTYTPAAGFAGTEVFSYTICDLDALATFGDNVATRLVFCSTATVTVTTPVPARPPDPGSPATTTTTTTTSPTSAPAATPAATSTPASASPPAGGIAPLPRSGSDSTPIQTTALVFLVAGLVLLIGSRRRTSVDER